ncbi:TPA: hypothetical protein DEB00_01195 [Candidatus Uhrbacteria bacterium]|nr:hypothetical protein [Candidatus Uhrbacteria bacterium]
MALSLILGMSVFLLSLLPVPHTVMAAHTDVGEMRHISVMEASVCYQGCVDPTPCFDHCLQQAALYQREAVAVLWSAVKVIQPLPPARVVSFLTHKPLYRHILRSQDPWGHRHLSTQARE